MSGKERAVAYELTNVCKEFHVKGGKNKTVKALKNVTLTVYRGESFGIVGESGCGKSTLVKTMLGLYHPTSGQVCYDGKDINCGDKSVKKQLHSEVQVVFQDPFASLSPRMRVWEIIAEPLIVKGGMKKKELLSRVEELLQLTGLPASAAMKYPHQFSGGQRQRIAIARALSVMPKCIILDEPVSALDASVRAQVLNLLKDLQAQFDLTYIIIAHDLEVMEHVCDRIGVMYLGQLMELASCDRLFSEPLHPYTQKLFDSILTIDPEAPKKRVEIGDIPSPIDTPKGCPFSTRCAARSEACSAEPILSEVRHDHYAACVQLEKYNRSNITEVI
ncbi:ABC transporter ATP-binding protein [Brevibacillus sp. NRS-1366]|uniref:ABC transporter ATP-binding protein n=1 Tax=Brevibacillus sp. NRS-1366 TaxID=3233899 RepID=UPI003D1F7D7A